MKVTYDGLLSNFAFKSNLRRYAAGLRDYDRNFDVQERFFRDS